MWADKKCVIKVSDKEYEVIRDIMPILTEYDRTGINLSDYGIVAVLRAIARGDGVVDDGSGEVIDGINIEYECGDIF